uniref:Uncharacterized protein n=1 Tax=Romanomermis culicivorax TaxID=13658 RepID=A0A915HKV1_ROMCU
MGGSDFFNRGVGPSSDCFHAFFSLATIFVAAICTRKEELWPIWLMALLRVSWAGPLVSLAHEVLGAISTFSSQGCPSPPAPWATAVLLIAITPCNEEKALLWGR